MILMYCGGTYIVIASSIIILLCDILREGFVFFFFSFSFPILMLACGVGKFACGCGTRGFNLPATKRRRVRFYVGE